MVEVAAFTAGLLAEDVERLATRDLGPLVTVLSSLRSAAEALLSAVTAAALERGEPETCCDGGVSPRQWVTDWQGEGPRQAGRLLATTTALGRLPQVRAAYQRGLISSAHAQAACRAARQLPAGALGAGDRILATTAPHVLPEDVSGLVHRLVHTVDPDGAARRAEELTEGQHLSLDQFGDGSYSVHGLLGPAEGALVVAALAPLMVSTGEGDTRTRRRRCADALVEACRRTAAHPDGPGVHGVRPTVLLLVDETGHRPAETSDGTVLDRGAALALACDASTHRLSHAACPARATRRGPPPAARPGHPAGHQTPAPRVDRPGPRVRAPPVHPTTQLDPSPPSHRLVRRRAHRRHDDGLALRPAPHAPAPHPAAPAPTHPTRRTLDHHRHPTHPQRASPRSWPARARWRVHPATAAELAKEAPGRRRWKKS